MSVALVKEILAECDAKNFIVQPVWIPGVDNAADPPSRLAKMCPKRNAATWNLLHGAATRTERIGKRVPHDEGAEDDADETAQSFEEAIVYEFLRS